MSEALGLALAEHAALQCRRADVAQPVELFVVEERVAQVLLEDGRDHLLPPALTVHLEREDDLVRVRGGVRVRVSAVHLE